MLAACRLKQFLEATEPLAVILLRTIAAEAERTGSWEIPVDIQERIVTYVREHSGGGRCA